MGWVDELGGGILGLDSAPLIHYLEAHPTYLPLVDPLFAAVEAGRVRLVTSTITLVEVLTQPLRRGEPELAARYRDLLLSTAGMEVMPVTWEIVEDAALLRASRNLRTPDAVQVATAAPPVRDTFSPMTLGWPRFPT